MRVLIIGFGSIGKRHAQIVKKKFPHAEIAIFRRTETNDPCLTPKNFILINKEMEALNYSPDIAIVANPASFHEDFSTKLLARNIDILVEKPISHNYESASRIYESFIASQAKCQIGYNLQFLESLIFLKDYLDVSAHGEIYVVHCTVGQFLPNWRKDKHYSDSVSAQKKLGGGVLRELSHDINYLIWIFGKVNWVQSLIEKKSNLKIDVEDMANIFLECESEKFKKVPVTISMDFLRRDSQRKIKIICEKGTIKWDGIDNEVKFFSAETNKWQILFSKKIRKNQTYEDQFSFFINETKTSKSILGALETIRVIEAIELSNKEMKRIFLD